MALSEVLRSNTTLEKLDISCNRIHPPALLELMKGLCNNKVLKVLVVSLTEVASSSIKGGRILLLKFNKSYRFSE